MHKLEKNGWAKAVLDRYFWATSELAFLFVPGGEAGVRKKKAHELRLYVDPKNDAGRHAMLKHDLEFGTNRASWMLAFIAVVAAVLSQATLPFLANLIWWTGFVALVLMLFRFQFPIAVGEGVYEDNGAAYLRAFEQEIGARIAISYVSAFGTVLWFVFSLLLLLFFSDSSAATATSVSGQ